MKELIRYMKDNEKWIKGNNALIVAAISFILTLGTLYVKFVVYVYTMGKLSYWKIPVEFIMFNNTSGINNFVFYLFIFIYLLIPLIGFQWAFNRIFKPIEKGEKNTVIVNRAVVFIISFTMCWVYLSTFIILLVSKGGLHCVVCWTYSFKVAFVITGISLAFYGIKSLFNNQNKIDNIITLGIACILIVFAANAYGYNSADKQMIFELTEDKTYVVIHSYEDDYLLLACEVDETTNTIIIDTDTKVVKAKEDLVVARYQFADKDRIVLGEIVKATEK